MSWKDSSDRDAKLSTNRLPFLLSGPQPLAKSAVMFAPPGDLCPGQRLRSYRGPPACCLSTSVRDQTGAVSSENMAGFAISNTSPFG
jgi:hypothetical protein